MDSLVNLQISLLQNHFPVQFDGGFPHEEVVMDGGFDVSARVMFDPIPMWTDPKTPSSSSMIPSSGIQGSAPPEFRYIVAVRVLSRLEVVLQHLGLVTALDSDDEPFFNPALHGFLQHFQSPNRECWHPHDDSLGGPFQGEKLASIVGTVENSPRSTRQ